MRGATAATSGSSKWPSSGSSHPFDGTQSESTKATIGLSETARPALRAPDGPTLVASPTKRAPWRSAISLVAPASADASSTTMQARPPSAPSSRSSWARPVPHRHDDRDGVRPGAGTCRTGVRPRREGARRHEPARQHPCRRARADRGARPPTLHEVPGAGRNPEEAERAAAEQDRPVVERGRRGVLGQHEPGRERRRCPRGCAPQCRGRRRGAGGGHRPILAARRRR